MKKAILVLGLVSFLLVGIELEAVAQIPKEGTFSGIMSYTGMFKALPMGQERVQITYEVIGVVILDGGEGLFHNASFRCLGSLHAVKGLYEDDAGFCVNTVPDGDQVFYTYKATGKMGVGGKGTAMTVGGTGKLVGIEGSTEFTRISTVRPAAEGTFQGYNRIKGQYKLP